MKAGHSKPLMHLQHPPVHHHPSIHIPLLPVSISFQFPSLFYPPSSKLLTRPHLFTFPHISRRPYRSDSSESSSMTVTRRSSGTFMCNGCQTALMWWVKWHLGRGISSFLNFFSALWCFHAFFPALCFRYIHVRTNAKSLLLRFEWTLECHTVHFFEQVC